MGSDESDKFDMGRICEYCCVLVIGVIVLLTGNMLFGIEVSIESMIMMSIGTGIIAYSIGLAFLDHIRRSRKDESKE